LDSLIQWRRGLLRASFLLEEELLNPDMAKESPSPPLHSRWNRPVESSGTGKSLMQGEYTRAGRETGFVEGKCSGYG